MSSSWRSRLGSLTVLLLLAAGLSVLLRQGGEPGEMLSRRQMLMGTVVEITAYGENRRQLEAGMAAAFAEMARLEALLGPAAGSDIERLGQTTGELEVAPETAEVLALGLQVQEISAGAFDLGLGRLKALWEAERPGVPSAAQIETALAGSGAGSLQLEGRRVVRTDPQLQVDLGGIAKGYAIDRAVEILRRAGAAGASVNAGGDIRLLGDRQGAPWRIGIQHPRHPDRVLGVLPLIDTAVVTSGDYERFFEFEGVRYHHLFDPHTGAPGRQCQSVTVLAPNAVLADALATAAFILGPTRGLALLEQQPEVEGMIIDAAGNPHFTPALQGKIVWH